MNPLIHRIMMGSRNIGGTAQRFLGHSQRAIRVLGKTTNALNKVGIVNPQLNKINSYAQQFEPAIEPIQNAIASY